MRDNKQFGHIVDAHLLHLRSPHHQGGCDKAACKFDHDLCLLQQWVEIISEETSSILFT